MRLFNIFVGLRIVHYLKEKTFNILCLPRQVLIKHLENDDTNRPYITFLGARRRHMSLKVNLIVFRILFSPKIHLRAWVFRTPHSQIKILFVWIYSYRMQEIIQFHNPISPKNTFKFDIPVDDSFWVEVLNSARELEQYHEQLLLGHFLIQSFKRISMVFCDKVFIKAVHDVLLDALLNCCLVGRVSVLMRSIVTSVYTVLYYPFNQLVYFNSHC